MKNIILILFSASVVVIYANLVSSSCPMDLDFVLNIKWDSSACQFYQENGELNDHGASGTCCQTLTSLYGVGLARNLKQTNNFRLPDLNTSISCLSDFQEKLSYLSLPSNLTSSCFEPVHFVTGTDVCANIQTTQNWLDLVGRSTSLDSACRPDLSGLTACDACVQAGLKVHSQLLTVDHNSSHAKGCFYYTILYAAGIVNNLGPESMGAISCILGLPISLDTKSDNIGELALKFGSAGAGSAVFVACILVALYLGWKTLRKKKKRLEDETTLETDIDDEISWPHWQPKNGSLWFKIRDLEEATNYFSPNNCIGRGQSGIVYKGTLKDGTVVAVKKITESDFQGDAEFLNEVEIIGNLKHRNLVPLRGCCVSNRNQNYGGETQRYLVYDYMPNGNLNEHLFFSQGGRVGIGSRPLTWPQRKNIILDIANALAYLHYGIKPAIYHRDIKTTNILLDEDMRARVADFGLARQSRESDSPLTTRVAGTHGYLAPEYALYGQLTEKSDVYSFGIVVLEILTGKTALNLPSSSGSFRTILITDWVWSLVKEGKVEEAFDPSLLRNAVSRSRNPKGIMERFLMVGILCAHLMVALRPNILDALKMLEGDIEVPAILDRPIYADQSTLYSLYKSSSHQTQAL